MRSAFIGLAIAMIAAPLAAQTTTTGTSAGGTAKKERQICQREEKTGSRLGGGKKVCHTEAEWNSLRQSDTFTRQATAPSDLFRRSGTGN